VGTLGAAVGGLPRDVVSREADLLSSNACMVGWQESGCGGGDFSDWHEAHFVHLWREG